MSSKLRKLDEQAEVLTQLYDNGRISEARFLAAIRKLTERAAATTAISSRIVGRRRRRRRSGSGTRAGIFNAMAGSSKVVLRLAGASVGK
jgi:hypothetical protein